jgi:DNA-binding protein HU-beta
MNKAQLVDRISEDAGISKKQAGALLDSMIDSITQLLQQGRKINLIGLGIFRRASRAERNGRNPQTGAVIRIAGKKTVKFGASFELSDALNTGEYAGLAIKQPAESKGYAT